MYYHTMVTYDDGRRRRVEFRSEATTPDGIARALGRAIAKQLGTDVFETSGRVFFRRYKDDFRLDGQKRIDDRKVWAAAHDALLG